MKRYFKIQGRPEPIELNTTASEAELSVALKLPLREIPSCEYRRLMKEKEDKRTCRK